MSLVPLIDAYKADLKVPSGSDSAERYARSIAFRNALIGAPVFEYGRREMSEAMIYMMGRNFGRAARCLVVGYALRRAAVEPLPREQNCSANRSISQESVWKWLNLSSQAYDPAGRRELLKALNVPAKGSERRCVERVKTDR